MTISMKTALAASTAIATLIACAPAFAAEGSPTSVDELIVTAEKREVNIQEVPAAVSAINGDALTELGLNRLTDYSQYLPGFNVSNLGSPGQASVTLRGIAAVGPGSVVGYYLDDTPVGSSGNYAAATILALDLLPYDVERLEVLRGPQGTLYGAGSMGGLLKYVLKDAKTDRFSANVGADLTDTENGGVGYGVRAAVNVPLGDKFALRISGYDQQTPGYTDNVLLGLDGVDDVHQYGGRVAATWRPTDTLTINANALWTRLRSDDNAEVTLGSITTHSDPGGGVLFEGEPVFGEFAQSHPFQQPFNKDIDYYSATVNWDAGPVSLVSATSWSKTNTLRTTDASYAYGQYPVLFGLPAGVAFFENTLDLKKFTQEFRIVSPTGGRIEWLAGAFYTREESTNEQLVQVFDANYDPIPSPIFSPFFAIASLPSTYREAAIFGDLTFNVTDKFDVTGGVRYARNWQHFLQISDGIVLGGFTQSPGVSDEDVTTWMVNARYRFNDDIMAYARVATGYRPGGPNIAIFGAKPTVSSDTLISYEAGLKTTLLDGKLLFNIAAFNIDWTDIQLRVTDVTKTVGFLDNAGDAFSRGVELEGYWLPIEGLKLGFNAAYTKAELTSVAPNADPFILGYQLPGVPKWSGGLTADYGWTLANDWRASVGAGARYVGEEYTTAVTAPGFGSDTKDPSYTTLDLRAGLSNDRWSVSVWARNVTDERVYLNAFPQFDPVGGSYNGIEASVMTPRTVGVTFDANF